jgi:hypothetical protein
MKPVVFPLKPQMQDETVRNLQRHLRMLLFFKQGFHLNDDERLGSLRELRSELAGAVFGPATEKAVGMFQKQNHLETNGMVDEATAGALNAALRHLGAFRIGTAKVLNAALENWDVFDQAQPVPDQPAAGGPVVEPVQMPVDGKTSQKGSDRSMDLETTRIRYAFWLAVIGLTLSISLAIFLYINGMSGSTELVAVVGVFTGVTGTLVGMFFGVQVGSAGKEQERTERKKADLMTRMAFAMMNEDQVKDALNMFQSEWKSEER